MTRVAREETQPAAQLGSRLPAGVSRIRGGPTLRLPPVRALAPSGPAEGRGFLTRLYGTEGCVGLQRSPPRGHSHLLGSQVGLRSWRFLVLNSGERVLFSPKIWTAVCTNSGLFCTVCVPFFPFMQSFSALAAEVCLVEKTSQRVASEGR